MYRKALTITKAIIIIFVFSTTVFASTIPIIINGEEIESDVPPVLIENRTMVPIRVISENLEAQVVWQDPYIIIQRDNIELKLTLNSKVAYKNGVAIPPLEAAPFLQNDRTMVPLRFIAEVLDIDIIYEDGKVLVDHNPKTAFLTEEEIIYQDSFIIFGIKGGVPYITSVLDSKAGLPAEEFAYSINVREQLTDGQTVYFSYHPPGTNLSLACIYAFKDGKTIRAFNISPLYWEVNEGYIYSAVNPYPAINDISTNKPPYNGNLFRVDITKDYDEQELEYLGVEGYLYGYEIVFAEWDIEQVQGVKDGDLTPKFEIREDGIYAMGVELHSANARATYGYYKISLEGRAHEKINTIDAE